jgi:hypothetical protein
MPAKKFLTQVTHQPIQVIKMKQQRCQNIPEPTAFLSSFSRARIKQKKLYHIQNIALVTRPQMNTSTQSSTALERKHKPASTRAFQRQISDLVIV